MSTLPGMDPTRKGTLRLRVAACGWTLMFLLASALPFRAAAQTEKAGFSSTGGSEDMALARWAREYLRTARTSGSEEEASSASRLEGIRAMYFLSVQDRDWIEPMADSLDAVAAEVPPETQESVTLQAYRASLEVVRAKHARWPPNKLKHLRRGSEALDRQVRERPDELELRYLRFASYRFLPFFLSRNEAVEADRDALVAGFTRRPQGLPPTLFRGMVQFLLDHAEMDRAERDSLRETLAAPQGR